MSYLIRERFEAWLEAEDALPEGEQVPMGMQKLWRCWQAALAADVRGSPPKDLGESKKNQQNSGPEFGASIVKPPLSPT
jgi:hypothetical protein